MRLFILHNVRNANLYIVYVGDIWRSLRMKQPVGMQRIIFRKDIGKNFLIG